MFKNKKVNFTVVFALFLFCLPKDSWSLECVRKTQGHTGFVSQAYFEKSFPKTKIFFPEQFKPVGGTSKSIIAIESATFKDGGSLNYNWRLLPSGKMVAFVRHGKQSTLNMPGNVHYNCNMKPEVVLAAKNDVMGTPGKDLGSYQGSVGAGFGSYAGGPGPTAVDTKALNKVKKSELTKAKSECSTLGFTAGTEKHGDCVMKLMDTIKTKSGNKCASYIEKSTPEDVRSLADALLKGGVSAYQQNRVLYIDQQVVGIELPDGEVVGCDPR